MCRKRLSCLLPLTLQPSCLYRKPRKLILPIVMSSTSPFSASVGASARSPTSAIGSPLNERQVATFQAEQKKVLAEDTAYLSAYPELSTLLATFCKAVLKEKPTNVREFAKEYFNREVDAGPE